jgi:hypothetical protein
VGQNFSPLHVSQTGSGAHPASYPVGTRGRSPWVKQLGHEADSSRPTSSEVKNNGRWSLVTETFIGNVLYSHIKLVALDALFYSLLFLEVEQFCVSLIKMQLHVVACPDF